MSFLDSLIQGAQGFLGDAIKRGGRTDAIGAFRYDHKLYDEMRGTVPAFSDMVRGFEDIHPFAVDLTRDALLEFYKGAPQVTPQTEMADTHKLNQAVAEMLHNAPETPDMRRLSMVDKYSSVMATLTVAEKLKEWLKDQQELLEQQKAMQELLEQLGCPMGMPLPGGGDGEGDDAEGGESQGQGTGSQGAPGAGQLSGALGALANALNAAQAAGQALDGAMGDFDGNGPLTEAQASAMAAAQEAAGDLQAAMEKAQETQAAANAAAEKFELESENAALAVRPAIVDALAKAKEGLLDELNQFHAWGLDDGQIKQLSFPERAALAKQLLGSRFAKYASYIGRTRFVGAAQQVRKVESGREEIVGTEQSGDIARIMASEWVRFRHPKLRLRALADLASGHLLSKKMIGTERVGKGALIVGVDNSDSMNLPFGSSGLPREVPAKAFMLALLDEARRTRRDFAVINFSSPRQQRMWKWDKGVAPINEVMECVEHMYAGGTWFETPIDMAIELLRDEYNGKKKQAGDIVFITDDDCRVSDAWLNKFRVTKKEMGFRVYGVAVGMHPGGALKSISDDVRGVFDGIEDMTEIIRHL